MAWAVGCISSTVKGERLSGMMACDILSSVWLCDGGWWLGSPPFPVGNPVAFYLQLPSTFASCLLGDLVALIVYASSMLR